MRHVLTVLAALCVVMPLSAARDFTANTANYMKRGNDSFGERFHLQSGSSQHAWVYLDSLPSSGQQWIIVRGPLSTDLTGPVGLHLFNSAGTTKLRAAGRSAAADSVQIRDSTTAMSTGAWLSLGAVFNFAGDTITPYVNGSADNGGSVTFISGTYQHTAVSDSDFTDSIGGAINSSGVAIANTQVDGRIAEVAVWTGDIGAAGYAQLARGVSATQVSPQSLIFYMPLSDSGTRSYVTFVGHPGNDETWPYTVTGSLPLSPHVPMFRHPGEQ